MSICGHEPHLTLSTQLLRWTLQFIVLDQTKEVCRGQVPQWTVQFIVLDQTNVGYWGENYLEQINPVKTCLLYK